jgi:hypothetical protein
MKIRARSVPLPGAFALTALLGLAGCLGTDAKQSDKSAAAEQTQQVSSVMKSRLPLNEQGEIIAEIPPQILANMKESLRAQAQLSAAADLEDWYDPVTGKLRGIDRLPELQAEADSIARVLAKGGAR